MTNQDLEQWMNKFDENTSLNEIQEYINEMIKTRGFDKETPQDVMLLLTEEIGELAKEVRKTTSIKMEEASRKKIDLEGEIADVFMYVLAMCRATNVDLLEALKNKEKKNYNREWK